VTGGLELDGSHARVPGAGPVAVSIGGSLRGAFERQGADLTGDFGFHHSLGEDPHPLAQGIDVVLLEKLADKRS
jgi:hypothetical protein